MSRQAKLKKVCRLPICKKFAALENDDPKKVTISVEEYEAVRLLDYQGFTQEKSAEIMGVARTTLQAIYEQARRHISKAIVEGSHLIISGGNYYLCSGEEAQCDCGGCEKHKRILRGEE